MEHLASMENWQRRKATWWWTVHLRSVSVLCCLSNKANYLSAKHQVHHRIQKIWTTETISNWRAAPHREKDQRRSLEMTKEEATLFNHCLPKTEIVHPTRTILSIQGGGEEEAPGVLLSGLPSPSLDKAEQVTCPRLLRHSCSASSLLFWTTFQNGKHSMRNILGIRFWMDSTTEKKT